MTGNTSRSRPLSAALAGLALAAAAPGAVALEKVKFGTNWLAQAEHGGYYQAVADGTYAACGLDVEIVPGSAKAANNARIEGGGGRQPQYLRGGQQRRGGYGQAGFGQGGYGARRQHWE